MLKRMTALLAAALLTASLAACGTMDDIQKNTESGAPPGAGLHDLPGIGLLLQQ